jgi:hypothetical protein
MRSLGKELLCVWLITVIRYHWSLIHEILEKLHETSIKTSTKTFNGILEDFCGKVLILPNFLLPHVRHFLQNGKFLCSRDEQQHFHEYVLLFGNESKGKDSKWHVYAFGFLSLESLTHTSVCGTRKNSSSFCTHMALCSSISGKFSAYCHGTFRIYPLSIWGVSERGKTMVEKFFRAERYRDNDLLLVKPFVHALMISWINLDSIIPRSMTFLRWSISRKNITHSFDILISFRLLRMGKTWCTVDHLNFFDAYLGMLKNIKWLPLLTSSIWAMN